MANDKKYSCSMTPVYEIHVLMCDQCMLGVFYSNEEYDIVSYDVMCV